MPKTIEPRNPHPLTIQEIAKAVVKEYALDMDSLRRQSRLHDVSEARHIYRYLCSKYTNATAGAIAEYIGRGASTVAYSVKCVEFRMKSHQDLVCRLQKVKNSLNISD